MLKKINLPIGTQVVTPDGRVAEVTESPTEESPLCRIRFLDDSQATVKAAELIVRKVFQKAALEDQPDFNPRDSIIFQVVVGSRAYGLDNDASDTDMRGVYLPSADLHWSLYGVPEQIEFKETEECYWELEKFLILALKANPNVLECLYSPLIEKATPLANEMLNLREAFLSRLVYQTFCSYVMSQFKKFERILDKSGVLRWKHAMHLVRLLLSAKTILLEGYVPVRVTEHRDRLLSIKYGQMSWSQVDAWRRELQMQVDEAYARTPLPIWPDYAKVNDFLIRARYFQAKQLVF